MVGLLLILSPLLFVLLLFLLLKAESIRDLSYLPFFWRKMFAIEVEQPSEKIEYGAHKRQYFLLSAPTNHNEKEQIILYIHGGGWQFGSPEAFRPLSQLLSQQGYYTVLVSHRRLPFYRAEHLAEDLELMLMKLQETLHQKNIADKKLILGGMSSGGNLAALLAFDRSRLQRCGFEQSQIAGAFFQAAPLDLTKMKMTPPLYNYAGQHGSARFTAANPINYLTYECPFPVFISHGTNDGVVEKECSYSFSEALRNNSRAEVCLNWPAGMRHVQSSDWVLEDNDLRKALFAWLGRVEQREQANDNIKERVVS